MLGARPASRQPSWVLDAAPHSRVKMRSMFRSGEMTQSTNRGTMAVATTPYRNVTRDPRLIRLFRLGKRDGDAIKQGMAYSL
jgi:hypothetical protein